MSSLLDRVKNYRKDQETVMQEVEGFFKKEERTYEDEDPNLYTFKKDEAGNVNVRFRFLPPIADFFPEYEEEVTPIVEWHEHTFKDAKTGKWLWVGCPTTFGLECPVCEYNSELWKSGNKDLARHQGRKYRYAANIVVIKDPTQPENEGKVFSYKFGKAILKKIEAAKKPLTEEEIDVGANRVPISPFYIRELGADFVLKGGKKGDNFTYDDSYFTAPCELWGGDEQKIVHTLEQLEKLPLQRFIKTAKDKLLSYDEIRDKFMKVRGVQVPVGSPVSEPTSPPQNQSRDTAFDDLPFDTKEPDTPKPPFELNPESKQSSSTSDEELLATIDKLVN